MNDALDLEGEDIFEMKTSVDINLIMIKEEIQKEKDP